MQAHTAPAPDALGDPVSAHLLPLTSTVGPDGRLSIGGVDVLHLAEEHGTPLFVYDEAHIRARCREAVAAFGDSVAYATKAFLCKAMASVVCEEGLSLDVSTAGELRVALSAGVPPDRLILHGNNKSEEELVMALLSGVGYIVVDSFDEIERLEKLTDPAGHLVGGPGGFRTARSQQVADLAHDHHRPKILVRVTPGIDSPTHEFVQTGQDDSKFGFGLASGAAAEAIERTRHLPGVELVGIHSHVGSQVFDLDTFCDSITVLAEFVLAADLPELCVGGGLGVGYVNSECAPSIAEWAHAIREACQKANLTERVRVSVEPGRSIVAAAAVTLYRVGTVKKLPGIRTYVAVDGGMSDNPRPVVYGSGYEAFLPRETFAPRPLRARIVGKHCESGDVLVPEAELPEDLVVGDVLATPVTGAYGYSMASNYNKVPRPPVIFVAEGKARVVVRGEHLDDLLRLDV